MVNIVHISDLHFGKPYVPKVGEALLVGVAELDPDVLVVSGDLTQRAKISEFERASDFLNNMYSNNDGSIAVTVDRK